MLGRPALAAREKELNILSWEGYNSAQVLDPFRAASGATVRAGQPAGRIHQIFDPQRAPVELHYAADGVLFAKRHPGAVVPGNVCCVVATPA